MNTKFILYHWFICLSHYFASRTFPYRHLDVWLMNSPFSLLYFRLWLILSVIGSIFLSDFFFGWAVASLSFFFFFTFSLLLSGMCSSSLPSLATFYVLFPLSSCSCGLSFPLIVVIIFNFSFSFVGVFMKNKEMAGCLLLLTHPMVANSVLLPPHLGWLVMIQLFSSIPSWDLFLLYQHSQIKLSQSKLLCLGLHLVWWIWFLYMHNLRFQSIPLLSHVPI